MTNDTEGFLVPVIRYGIMPAVLALLLCGCKEKAHQPLPLEEIAANEEVLAFMKTFDGRGALSDSTRAMTPEKSLAAFRHPQDLNVDLVLAEPAVTQPVHIHFDHRGRLWVVQYNQYPYPDGLKVTSMDQHIRATFDKIPPPPGVGATGADKITFFEDTNGDGTYDRATDAITGLNIATSVVLGRGQIWVLNPPYLLAYPDEDDDGTPDAAPVVHLEGFGLEDTHAVANNLRWGPDGWLYGAQGSTCTANVSSATTKNVKFDGQVIWRYHPDTRVFEVFAEGGGNTFDVEIDAKGRLYSGDNGTSRGQYYKQGAYFVRNFGKHGALTNPYAFGFLSNMALTGDRVRFTHAFIRYEGGALPERYRDRMIAINPLQSFVQLSRFQTNGSTFSIVDEARILETEDHWFRPVDITLGPDGGVYIADWYDSRLSHVDPRDTWSKINGRIYRISGERTLPVSPFNIAALPGDQLVRMLSHTNRWFRQQALTEFGNRRDRSVIPALKELFGGKDGQLALEALWALHLSGGFTEEVVLNGLRHHDPFVRLWTVRLAGDAGDVTASVASALGKLSASEQHPEVKSQLAATAKRLPAGKALPIIKNLLIQDDAEDPDLPLQLWWALESKAGTDSEAVVELFGDRSLWKKSIVRDVVLERLMQRYVVSGDASGYAACARLISLAPSKDGVKLLLNGLQEGLRGRDIVQLPPVLVTAIQPYQQLLSHHPLTLALRQGDSEAIERAIQIIADRNAPIGERLAYIKIFGEINEPKSVAPLLAVVENNQSSAALKQAALQALQRYDSRDIGARVVRAYPDRLRADTGVRLAALSLFATRPEWAHGLLNAIDRKKQPGEKFIARTIAKEDVPDEIVRMLKSLDDPDINAMTARIWPDVRLASHAETSARMGRVSNALTSGKGDPVPGRTVFRNTCGSCHRLFDEGGTLGPDLTGYDRLNTDDLIMNIVDPNAYVREGYVTYRVTTVDGRVLTGTVATRGGSSMTLILLTGEEVILPDQEVKEMRSQPSMMPDNLLEPLTDQQIRDLFAYLAKKS